MNGPDGGQICVDVSIILVWDSRTVGRIRILMRMWSLPAMSKSVTCRTLEPVRVCGAVMC